jgi:hypothetical protein
VGAQIAWGVSQNVFTIVFMLCSRLGQVSMNVGSFLITLETGGGVVVPCSLTKKPDHSISCLYTWHMQLCNGGSHIVCAASVVPYDQDGLSILHNGDTRATNAFHSHKQSKAALAYGGSLLNHYRGTDRSSLYWLLYDPAVVSSI